MSNTFSRWFKENEKRIIIFLTIATLSAIFYRSFHLIQTVTTSILDEGMYVVKGYYFAIGKYQPFEKYGPVTNHMPLSFLIPGYIQKWFGPGVRTARYFVFFLNIIFYIGLWASARRLGGDWWGLFALGIWQLNPYWVEFSATGNSQILILSMLVWVFFFIFGGNKRKYELIIASVLSAIIFLTRLNLAPLLLIIPYIYWQHGKDIGNKSLIGALIPILIVHFVYYPEIFNLWDKFNLEGLIEVFSKKLFSSTPITLKSKVLYSISNASNNYDSSLVALGEGIRLNIVSILSEALLLISFIKIQKSGISTYTKKLITFLGLVFSILFFSHAIISLMKITCGAFCFAPYMLFFTPLSIFLIIIITKNINLIWNKKHHMIFVFAIIILLLIPDIFDPFVGANFYLDGYLELTSIEIPRYSNGIFLPGTGPIWGVLENFFSNKTLSLKIIPMIRLFEILSISFIAPLLLWKIRNKISGNKNLSSLIYSSFLVLVIIAPIAGFGRNISLTKCEDSIIDSFENFGNGIKEVISPNSLIFLEMTNTTSYILEYLNQPKIFPVQMNGVYFYHDNYNQNEANELLEIGRWNRYHRSIWQEEADFILIEGLNEKNNWQERIDNGEFKIVFTSSPIEECRNENAIIYVLQKTELFQRPLN
jgi:hypothetical protein